MENNKQDLQEVIEALTAISELAEHAEELDQMRKENETVFEAEFGNGVKFKGTKSDYFVFMDGFLQMIQLGTKTKF